MYIVFAILVLIVLGSLWQKTCCQYEAKLFRPEGCMMNVNGRRMHVLSKGTGTRVVLLAGWNCPVPSADFQPLANELIKQGFRPVIVEKFGYGFSENTPEGRNIDVVINEMRQALADAGEAAPYLLCGHSLAGTEAVRWANRYPNEVLGVITLDAPAPLCYTHVPLPPRVLLDVQTFLRWSGIWRALMLLPAFRRKNETYVNEYRYLTADLLPLVRAMQCKHLANATVKREIRILPENCRIAGGELPTGIRQLMLIASDTKKNRYDMLQPEQDEYIARNHPRVEMVDGLHNLQQFEPERIACLIAEEWKEVAV